MVVLERCAIWQSMSQSLAHLYNEAVGIAPPESTKRSGVFFIPTLQSSSLEGSGTLNEALFPRSKRRILRVKWWAVLDLNQRPLRCQRSVLPLN